MSGAEIMTEGSEVVLVLRVILRKVRCHVPDLIYDILIFCLPCSIGPVIVFVCVAALAILDRLDVVDVDTLVWWLSERQQPSGGLNGRPEKLEDVSHSKSCCCHAPSPQLHSRTLMFSHTVSLGVL